MNQLTSIIKEDMKPALGVTEPGAIAYAVALARDYVREVMGPVDARLFTVNVALNSGMYKNAFSCGVPGTAKVGNVTAAALGLVAGETKRGLEALSGVTRKADEQAAEIIRSGRIQVEMDHIGSEITICAKAEAQGHWCEVNISGSHTNIVSIVRDDETIFSDGEKTSCQESETAAAMIHDYSVEKIYEYVISVPAPELTFIGAAFEMNMELFRAGAESQRTTFVHRLLQENGGRWISDDALKTACLLANGAIEARVLGLDKPAMSITGSGAHGIIATLPLYAFQQVNKQQVTEEELYRAAALSCLITMYIKEYSGRLSAFCGCGIAAGTGMACGLCMMMGGRLKELSMVIQNMASGITGMICDGGNQGCVMKGITATDAAFRAADFAMQGICVDSVHGINGKTPEQTMKQMGMIASPGMTETEKTIVSIMESKR